METTTQQESTRALMQAYGQALQTSGDYARFLAEDVTITLMETNQEISGREAAHHFIHFFHQQAFNTAIEVRQIVFGETNAMAELVFVGTHIGEFEGIPPTNKQVRLPYVATYDIADEKIKALRLYFPMFLLLQSLKASA